MQQMGKIANPYTDKIERDMRQAKLSIDMLEMIETRTSGNLTGEEARFLKHVLTEVRLNYVAEVEEDKKRAAAPPPQGALTLGARLPGRAPPASPPPSSDPARPAPPRPASRRRRAGAPPSGRIAFGISRWRPSGRASGSVFKKRARLTAANSRSPTSSDASRSRPGGQRRLDLAGFLAELGQDALDVLPIESHRRGLLLNAVGLEERGEPGRTLAQERPAALLAGLAALPFAKNALRVQRAAVTEDVRVALDHLGDRPAGHRRRRPAALLLQPHREERDQEEKVAQLLRRGALDLTAAMASVTSWASSTRYGESVRVVCSRSHGHPSGPERCRTMSMRSAAAAANSERSGAGGERRGGDVIARSVDFEESLW